MKQLLPIELNPLESIGASRVNDLFTCPLKVYLDNGINFSISPPSPGSILGSLIHKMFELSHRINNENEFEEVWSKELNELLHKHSSSDIENYLNPFFWVCKHYWPKKNIVKTSILRSIYNSSYRSEHTYKRKEYGLEYSYFKGIVDFIAHAGNILIIKDYKTGNIFESRKINEFSLKKSYVNQLKLYAAFALKKNPTLVNVQLYLININGQEYKINSTVQECIDFLNSSEAQIIRCNKLFYEKKYDDLAKINDNCKYCNGRIFCPKYEEMLPIGTNSLIYDLSGNLEAFSESTLHYEIKVHKNKISHSISNIAKQCIDKTSLEKNIGEKVIVFNLTKNRKRINSFSGTLRTTIFSFSDLILNNEKKV